jgi:hypothetical protein
MPEYTHEDLAPRFSIIVNFARAEDVAAFAVLVQQRITARVGLQRQSIWFPAQEIAHPSKRRYISTR